jgi:hypothetical protein
MAEVALVAEAPPSFRHFRHFRHLYISCSEKGVFFAQILAYMHFLLYLCTPNGGQTATLMQTFVKNHIHYEVFNS